MCDDRIRAALHTAADECLSGVENMPTQRWKVLARLEGTNPVTRRKRMLVPALAMMLTLAIVGAAAAGLGLFGLLRESKVDETDYARLALLEDAAVTVGETVQIGESGELTVDQAYCDGRKLYYSYTLKMADAETSMYVGDGAALEDGTYLPPVQSWIESAGELTTVSYYEVALPEGYALGETVAFTLTVISHRADGSLETDDVQVCAPVTGELKMLTGEGAADGYAAKAELFVSDVDVSGSVRIAAPEDYEMKGYELMADGAAYRNLDGWWTYDGEAHVLNLRFDLPGTLEDMKLVPLDEDYAHEAIALKGE